MSEKEPLQWAAPAGSTELLEAPPEVAEVQGVDMIYGLHAKPPLRDALAAALQHVMAAFVNIIAPAMVVGNAIGLDQTTPAF
jgi:xanthine permease XanP